MMRHTVSLVKTSGIETEPLRQAVERALSLIGSPLQAIGPDSRVIIKPNITADNLPWEQGIVTNPHLIRAIIELVMERGPKEVAVAEAIAVGLDVKKAYKYLGLDQIARETGAVLLDLYDHEFVPVPGQGGLHETIRISRPVLEADYVINVPVMKTHVAGTISVAMKNLMGVVSSEQKRRFHYYGLLDSIIQLNRLYQPDLTIADGSVAGEGNGPAANTAADFRHILASRDCRALDTVSARVMGFEPGRIKYLQMAAEAFGPLDLADIQVEGETLENCIKQFKPCAAQFTAPPGIECDTSSTCEECAGVLQLALDRFAGSEAVEKLKPLRIVCGPQDYEPQPGENVIVVGKCQAHMRNSGYFVPGCPPQVFLVADGVRELLGQERIFGGKEDFIFPDKQ